MRKIIKIFLASSMVEFKHERNELGRFILGINNMNLQRGIYCFLELCENYDSSISARKRKQDDYNEFIKDADAVFVLFCKKAGDYTIEEMKLAKECFKANGRPKVYTYFKDFDEKTLTDEVRKAYVLITEEYRHFFGTFESMASIEVEILRAMFEVCPDEALRVKEEEGIIYIGEEAIINADELDYIKNNKAIEELKARITGLYAGDKKYTEGLYGEEIDEEIERCKKRLKERYSKSFKAIEDRYKSISSGIETDPQLQLAYNLSAKGDYRQTIKILDREELRLETEKTAKERELSAKRYTETTFEKYKLRISALIQEGNNTELEETYKDAVEAIRRIHLYEIEESSFDVWYDFISFLNDINKDKKAIGYAEEEEGFFYIKDCIWSDYNKSALYNLLGILFYDNNQPDKAEEYYLKAIEIREKLAENNPERYKGDLAVSYNNAGVFYDQQGQPDKAEEHHLKAIKIREELAEKNPKRYKGDLAVSYNNAGLLYIDHDLSDNAEKYYLKAIEILEKLAEKNPEKYKGVLATIYNNAGCFYAVQGQPKKAEEYCLKAIEIQEELAEKNPEKYKGDLAAIYNNAGILCEDQGQSDKAEEYYLKAIEIREELAEKNPEKYKGALATSYNNAGVFYKEQGQSDKAEEYYLKAIEIQEELAEKNPEKYKGDLAGSYNNAGVFYKEQGQSDKAEEYYLKAIEIFEALAERNPEKYKGYLAISYNNAGAFYYKQGQPDKAEEYYLKARKILEDLR